MARRPRQRSGSPRGPSSRDFLAPSPACGQGCRRRPVPDLEQELSDLSAAIAWPPTPRLRIVPPVRRRPAFPRWALAAAAALVIAAGVLIYTPAREAIANFLNLHT